MVDKKLTNQQLLGAQGVALIDLVVSGIGFVWRPTSQHDTGIDGEIDLAHEIRTRLLKKGEPGTSVP